MSKEDKENQLIVEDKNGKICLEWHVNQRSNCDKNFDGEYIDWTTQDLHFDIFRLGLVIRTLVENIKEKTPDEYKKFFYTKKTLKSDHPKYPRDDQDLNRLKIFNWEGDEKNELARKEQHMSDFFSLWSNYKFGYWKTEYIKKDLNEETQDLFEDTSNAPPFLILFEWEYLDFFTFDFKRDLIGRYELYDLFYLSIEMSPLGGPRENPFYCLGEFNEDKLKSLERKGKLDRHNKRKAQIEEEWYEKQKNQKDLF